MHTQLAALDVTEVAASHMVFDVDCVADPKNAQDHMKSPPESGVLHHAKDGDVDCIYSRSELSAWYMAADLIIWSNMVQDRCGSMDAFEQHHDLAWKVSLQQHLA